MQILNEPLSLAMKKKPTIDINGTFGQRLKQLRKAKGLTQVELGKLIGVSQRLLTYYERRSKHIPANLLPALAKALRISVDELLGLKSTKEEFIPKHSRIWKKLIMVEELPPKDQKVILHYINTIVKQYAIQKA